MLRLFAILLLLANGVYYAWAEGHLALLGWVPAPQTEPARMAAQIKPQSIRLLSSTEAGRLDSTASTTASAAAKPLECLQSPVLPQAVAQAVDAAAAALPSTSWSLEAADLPGRWIVYMGKYNDPTVLAKKKSELRVLGVSTESLQNANLEPGISLGGFASQSLANQELSSLSARGVHSAKVVQETAPSAGKILRLPAVDDALRGQLEPVKAAMGSATLRTCPV
jgi:hypothetical protein